jgi:chromodomain-helicase-DNA-binding protein 4
MVTEKGVVLVEILFLMILLCNHDSLLKEVYLEDQRKPEWFEVDRAIACRRKSVPAATCDILASFEDNKDFGEYEFLVKWKGLDYCEATWEPASCTEGVQAAIFKLIERHQNTLKRTDCVSSVCLDDVSPKEIHNSLYDYQLQGLQWIFDNFKTKKNVILAGMLTISCNDTRIFSVLLLIDL